MKTTPQYDDPNAHARDTMAWGNAASAWSAQVRAIERTNERRDAILFLFSKPSVPNRSPVPARAEEARKKLRIANRRAAVPMDLRLQGSFDAAPGETRTTADERATRRG